MKIIMPIYDLSPDERPRERIIKSGASAVSDKELLAIILGTGTRQEDVLSLAERILEKYGGITGLAQVTPKQLEALHGVGQAKVSQILAAVELGRRISNPVTEERPVVKTAADAARLMRDMANLHQEHIRAILLDINNRVIATSTIYIGTVSAAVVRAAEIYREAIAHNAPAIIIIHNHPSGDPSPSLEDIQLTRRLIHAGELMDIKLLDHIIIGGNEWRSLKDMGLAF